MMRTRVPLRIAQREVRRRPGRTALVALLVALPVAAMTISIVMVRSEGKSSDAESWARYGQADAVLHYLGRMGEGFERTAPTVRSLVLSLPNGSRAVDSTRVELRVQPKGGRLVDLRVTNTPLGDPIAKGIHEMVSGRAPRASHEVALAERLAERLQLTVGENLVLERPERTLRVVGLVETESCLSCPTMVVAPNALQRVFPDAARDVGFDQVALIDLPDDITAAQLEMFTSRFIDPVSLRDETLQEWTSSEGSGFGEDLEDYSVRWTLVAGGMVLLVAGIVIAAAFSVGARRQLVTIGQLSANGVDPGIIRSALALQGTVTGVIGATAGLVIAAVLLLAGHGRVELILDQRIDGYSVRLSDLALVLIVGVGAATVAALIPARTAARLPTLAALDGRRPLPAVSARQVSRGVAAMVVGLSTLGFAMVGSQSDRQSGELWMLLALVGGSAELLGACALAPVVVARLEPLSVRLRGAWRLGARSLARHRSRTGAIVSAVAAAGALSIVSAASIQGAAARADDPDLPPDTVVAAPDDDGGRLTAGVREQVVTILGGARVSTVRLAQPINSSDRPIRSYAFAVPWPEREAAMPGDSIDVYGTIADEAVLQALRVDDSVRASLARDGLTILASWADPGSVTVHSPYGDPVEALAHSSRYTLARIDVVLITEQKARDLGLAVGLESSGTLFVADHPLTSSERDQLENLAFDTRLSQPGLSLRYASARSGPSPVAMELILSAVALVFAVLVVGTSLALAAAEARDERDVLTIAGAPPPVLARVAGVKAWLMAWIGALVAIPVGFLPVIVVARTLDGAPFPVIFPTRTAVVLVVLVPLVSALVAWVASATAQRVRPVRVSTATFE